MAKGKTNPLKVVKQQASRSAQSKADKKDERAEAEAKLAAIEKQEVEDCLKEYNTAVETILKKYNCRILVQGQFVGDKIKAGIAITKNKQ